jgi:hypothetical protein
MRDLISNNQFVRGANQTLSGVTPNASALIDTRGFSGATVYLMTGAVTDAGTASGFTMKLQHSDTTAADDFVDVPAAQKLGDDLTVTSDDDDNILVGGIGYVGIKRYVRAVVTGTTGTDAVVNILAHLGKPHRAPVTAVGATTAAT